jgi:hypothetical protein
VGSSRLCPPPSSAGPPQHAAAVPAEPSEYFEPLGVGAVRVRQAEDACVRRAGPAGSGHPRLVFIEGLRPAGRRSERRLDWRRRRWRLPWRMDADRTKYTCEGTELNSNTYLDLKYYFLKLNYVLT